MSEPERLALERLFRLGRLTRRQFITGLGAAGLTVSSVELLAGCGATPQPVAEGVARSLCLIVLDAFRPDYATLAPMPALQALIARGTTFERAWVGQLETQTPTAHATISTGLFPRNDGVIGFEWRDPETRREVLAGWEQGTSLGSLGRRMERIRPQSIPQTIKAADPRATVVTVSSEKVYAADTLAAHAADYVLFHKFGGGRLQATALPDQSPPRDFFETRSLDLRLPLRRFTDWDTLSTDLAVAAFQAFRPRALMVNLPGADVYGHAFGGPASPEIMAKVVRGQDRAIGRVVDLYRQAGTLEETLFVVAADHGMVPNHHVVTPAMVKAAVSRAEAEYLFHTGGSSKYIYLRRPTTLTARAVARETLRLPGVIAAYFRHGGAYEPAASTIEGDMLAAHEYLLGTFRGRIAPDVVAVYRENTVGTAIPWAYGNHGGLSWKVQHVPLVLSGPGIRGGVRSRAPARLVDVAPTVLHAMGLTAPPSDGIVLADALRTATAAEVHTQASLLDRLERYQDALQGESDADLSEDRRNGVGPPPAQSPTP